MPQGSFSGDARYPRQDNKGKGRETSVQSDLYDVQQHYQDYTGHQQPGGYSQGYEMAGNHSGYSQGYDRANQSGSFEKPLTFEEMSAIDAAWQARDPQGYHKYFANANLSPSEFPTHFEHTEPAQFSTAPYTDDPLRNPRAFASGSSQDVSGAPQTQQDGVYARSPGKTTYDVRDYESLRAFADGPGTYTPDGAERPQGQQLPSQSLSEGLRGKIKKSHHGWSFPDAPRQYRRLPQEQRHQRFSAGGHIGAKVRRNKRGE
jgi:hypothetical protein